MEPTLGVEEVAIIGLPDDRIDEAAALAATAWDVPPRGDELVTALRAPGTIALIAVPAANLAGPILGVTTATVDGESATSDETAIAAGARGRGLGRVLLERMIAELAAVGVRDVYGQSSVTRPRALRFFVRCGFEIVGRVIAHALPGFADGETVFVTHLAIPG